MGATPTTDRLPNRETPGWITTSGKFDPLLEKEKRLLRLFRHERAPYYVIGVASAGSRRDMVH